MTAHNSASIEERAILGHQGGKTSSKIQEKLQVPTHRFIKHVLSKWLMLEPAAKWLLKQWNCLNEYFLLYISTRKEQRTLNTVSYKRIVEYLNEKTIKCQLLFVLSSAKLFSQFTSFFQREDPLLIMRLDAFLLKLQRTIY